jgi:hypothetical protein
MFHRNVLPASSDSEPRKNATGSRKKYLFYYQPVVSLAVCNINPHLKRIYNQVTLASYHPSFPFLSTWNCLSGILVTIILVGGHQVI